MAERVHPDYSPPMSEASGQFSSGEFPRKPSPPPGTYVVQVPKDQIYRVPPPENAHRFKHLSNRQAKPSHCRRCFCCFLAVLFFIAVVAGISAAVLYLVFRPESPEYSVERISISGFNLTSSSPISPKFDVTVRAQNPNGKIEIYYEKGSSVDVYYNGVDLCNGEWPASYQPANNVTMFKTTLTGSKIPLTTATRKELLRYKLDNKTVPLNLNIRLPVKLKVGSVKTWTITVKVECDVTVDKLTAPSKVVSTKCSHDVKLW